jgi:hypothetical protein
VITTTVAASGNPDLSGEVLLVAGGNVTLSQSGQQITIAATGGVNSVAVTGHTQIRGDVVLVAGSGVGLLESGQNITISATGGVTSIAVTGNAAITGAVTLIAGSGVTLTESGQNITIASTGGGGGSGTVTSVAIATPNRFSVTGSPIISSGTITLANRAINAQTADYTLTATDSTVTFDASGASRTATLPTAVGTSGTVYVIKKIDSSTTNTVTLATTSAQTIDGIASGTLKLATQYESITVESDGANWLILDHKCDTSWTAYTPTCTGFGTVSNLSGQWMRSGDSIYVRVQFTAGTSTATEARVSLPYTSAGSPTIASIQLIGSWTLDVSFGAASTLLIETSVAYVTFGRQDGTDAGLTKIQGNGFPSSNQKMSLQSGPIPIANWFA